MGREESYPRGIELEKKVVEALKDNGFETFHTLRRWLDILARKFTNLFIVEVKAFTEKTKIVIFRKEQMDFQTALSIFLNAIPIYIVSIRGELRIMDAMPMIQVKESDKEYQAFNERQIRENSQPLQDFFDRWHFKKD